MSVAVAHRGRFVRPARSLLVELVGPAGVGKSTLADALAANDPGVLGDLRVWGLPRSDLLVAAFALLPVALAAAVRGRPLRRREFEQMIRLAAFLRVIDREARRAPRVLLMDEGPIFGLAWLDVFFEPDGDPVRARWRRRVIAEWARRLDAVVRMRAGDAVLADRIRSRGKPHLVKAGTDPEIFGFTARFRTAFAGVLDELVRAGDVPIVELWTDAGSIADRTTLLREMIEEIRRGR